MISSVKLSSATPSVGDKKTPKYHGVSIIEKNPENIVEGKKAYLQAGQGNEKVENKYRPSFFISIVTRPIY